MEEIYKLLHMLENVPTNQLFIAAAIAFCVMMVAVLLGVKFSHIKPLLTTFSVAVLLSGLAMSVFFLWAIISWIGLITFGIFFGIVMLGAAIWPYADDYIKQKKQEKVTG